MFRDHLPIAYERAIINAMGQMKSLTNQIIPNFSLHDSLFDRLPTSRFPLWLNQYKDTQLQAIVLLCRAEDFTGAYQKLKHYLLSDQKLVESYYLSGMIQLCRKKYSKAINMLNIADKKYTELSSQTYVPHNYVIKTFYTPTVCLHCQGLLIGIWNQGYGCNKCDVRLHSQCIKPFLGTCFTFGENAAHYLIKMFFRLPVYCATCNGSIYHQDAFYCYICRNSAHLDCSIGIKLSCIGYTIPWEEIFVERGICNFFLAEYTLAVEDFTRALHCSTCEEFFLYYFLYRGLSYYYLMNFPLARDDFNKVVSHDQFSTYFPSEKGKFIQQTLNWTEDLIEN